MTNRNLIPDQEWFFNSNTLEEGEDNEEFVRATQGSAICRIGSDVNVTDEGAEFTEETSDSNIRLRGEIMRYETNPFSIALWFKSTSNKGNSTIFGNRTDGGHGNFVCLRFASGKVSFEIDNENSGGYVAINTPKTYNDGAWHHIVAVRNGTKASLFMDGELAGEGESDTVVDLDWRSASFYAGYWYFFPPPLFSSEIIFSYLFCHFQHDFPRLRSPFLWKHQIIGYLPCCSPCF